VEKGPWGEVQAMTTTYQNWVEDNRNAARWAYNMFWRSCLAHLWDNVALYVALDYLPVDDEELWGSFGLPLPRMRNHAK
jgi:hypothetical protein